MGADLTETNLATRQAAGATALAKAASLARGPWLGTPSPQNAIKSVPM